MKEVSAVIPVFTGFPYILTHLTGELFHVTLLPQSNGINARDQYEIALYLASATKLSSLLITSGIQALYVDISGYPSNPIPVPMPRPQYIAYGKLMTKAVIPEDPEIIGRYTKLAIYTDTLHGSSPGYYVGNLGKGGRLATPAEIRNLSGRLFNRIPKGFWRCGTCNEWYGACLDTTVPRMVIDVHCRCQNNNHCARCGELLYDRMLNSNYFCEEDGRVWHVPGFFATDHQCPLAVESWVTKPAISRGGINGI